jgi:hypothetical protein
VRAILTLTWWDSDSTMVGKTVAAYRAWLAAMTCAGIDSSRKAVACMRSSCVLRLNVSVHSLLGHDVSFAVVPAHGWVHSLYVA